MIDVQNLREAIEAKGLSQAELARRVGVSPAAIQQLVNGSSKTSRSIREIARELDVTVDWLEGAVAEPNIFIDNSELKNVDLKNSLIMYNKVDKDYGDWPVIQSSWVSIGTEWLKSISGDRSDREVILMRVVENEMSPTIVPGDDLLCGYTDKYDGDPDGIWIFVYNKTVFCRRIRPIEDDWVSVDADNPMYASYRAKLTDITIHLKALWFGRRLTHS